MVGMRLPQSTLQPLFVRRLHLSTVAALLLLAGLMPASASIGAPQLASSPPSLRFGAIDKGQTETLLVTVTNTGNTSVTLSSIAVSNSEFATPSVKLPVTLTEGESMDLSVSFTPTATGWTGGTIKFISNASNPILALEVSGTGVTSEIISASPSILSFGSVARGSHSTVPVVITNARSWPVTLLSVQTTVSEFSLSGATFPVTLNAGQTLTLEVTFTPQATGEIGGSLFVYGPGLNIPLTGTGTAVEQYSVNLLWNTTEGAEGYNIYRSSAPNGTYVKLNSELNSNTAYTDNTVVSGQTYYYEATSVNPGGQESARSTPAVEAAVP